MPTCRGLGVLIGKNRDEGPSINNILRQYFLFPLAALSCQQRLAD